MKKEFTFDEFKSFRDDMISMFGADPMNLISPEDISVSLQEAKAKKHKKQVFKMSKITLDFDRGLNKRLDKLVQEGLELKDWYTTINSFMFGALGESDGCLFLLLLASTSPRNMLTMNFIEASKIFHGIKHDLEHNRDNLSTWMGQQINANEFSYDSNEFDLEIIRQMNATNMADTTSKIKNIRKVIKFFMDSGESISRDSTIEFLVSKFNLTSDTKKNILHDDALQSMKVYNFAVNLIYPNFYSKQGNTTWFFVTIDTWMLRVFFPNITAEESAVYFKDKVKYLELNKKIIDFSKKHGLLPHQAQASIWTAKLKEEGRDVDSFEKVIDARIKSMGMVNSGFKTIYEKIRGAMLEIAKLNYDEDREVNKSDVEVKEPPLFDDMNEEAPF